MSKVKITKTYPDGRVEEEVINLPVKSAAKKRGGKTKNVSNKRKKEEEQ